jgi:hypothetical protein
MEARLCNPAQLDSAFDLCVLAAGRTSPRRCLARIRREYRVPDSARLFFCIQGYRNARVGAIYRQYRFTRSLARHSSRISMGGAGEYRCGGHGPKGATSWSGRSEPG